MTKIAYLTIDDGPSQDMKQKVDFLVKKNIPVVWFCRGDRIEQRPDDVIYAIKKGHIIGNHTYSHVNCDETDLRICYREIKKADAIIEDIYNKAGVKRPAKYFRFPRGRCGGIRYKNYLPSSKRGMLRKHKLEECLKELGYTLPRLPDITYKYYNRVFAKDLSWYWTYDVREYAIRNPKYREKWGIRSMKDVYKLMEEDKPEEFKGLNYPHSAELILLHDHPETTIFFKEIIEKLLSKGLKFKSALK
ncbi:MAG: polysaccharide deacetylase family protein [Candidatus Woesearchaeota archaeon]